MLYDCAEGIESNVVLFHDAITTSLAIPGAVFREAGEADPEIREAVQAMIVEIEGKPCVNFGDYDGGVYVCRRLSGREIDGDSLNGECEWVDPEDARPGELTDGMAISCDCVRLGPGWFQDMYFGWYFVYDPALVARSMAGDHSWVKGFLETDGGKG